MAGKKVIAICQSGGEFEPDADGLLHYEGGDAHAMEIDNKLNFKDFKAEIAETLIYMLCLKKSLRLKYPTCQEAGLVGTTLSEAEVLVDVSPPTMMNNVLDDIESVGAMDWR